MYLDLAADRPSGYFLVGDERTDIPEIVRSGESLSLHFSEYGAEMQGEWDGSAWRGSYIRRRASGDKSFSFSASSGGSSPPSTGDDVPLGNFAVDFLDDDTTETTTAATFWKEGESLLGTLVAPDGDYGLLEGMPADTGRLHLHRFTGWQATLIELESRGGVWTGTFFAASNDKPRPFTLQSREDLEAARPAGLHTTMKDPAGCATKK